MAHAIADREEEGACIQVDICGDRPSRLARSTDYKNMAAPEKEVTICAIQLALLEKAASGLGALGFVWATVVLLGGFAITLQWKDFGFVSITLLIEGTRIFSRSHELELHRHATWSLTEASQSSFLAMKSRSRHLVESLKFIIAPFSADNAKIANEMQSSSRCTRAHKQCCTRPSSVWHSHNMQQLPLPLPIRLISSLFYWLQLVSAMTCVILSTMRLASQDFGNSKEAENSNRNFALNIFYAMALAEALVFLAEKVFWEWKVNYCGLLEKVSAECRLGPSGVVSIKRFFYDAYSKCVAGSIFDGLKMDLVTFAQELLVSSSGGEELMGIRLLLALSTHQHLSDAAIRKVGTSTVVIERLIEMLNWKSPSGEEIRYSAAIIVSKLASKEQNASRVAEIPGAMESISSLLNSSATLTQQGQMHDLLAFNLLGLLILKKLAKENGTCAKMVNTHGLLDKIIDFTGIANGMLNNAKAVKRSLQVVTMLASTTGHTGVMLRQEISENMFITSNIRDILHHGGHHLGLQRLALELLKKLAMHGDEAQERIGRTEGTVKELLGLFFQSGKTHEQKMVRVEAGEALFLLLIENKASCGRVLKQERTVVRLTEALGDPVLYVTSSRILQSLCAFAGPEWNRELSRSVDVAGLRRVLINSIMDEEEDVASDIGNNGKNVNREELMEASLSLAAQVLKFTSPAKLSEELRTAGLSEADLVKKLVGTLGAYKEASVRVPEIRRHAVEVAVELMRINKKKYGKMFREGGMAGEVRQMVEMPSEVECCNVRLRFSLDLLLQKALELML